MRKPILTNKVLRGLLMLSMAYRKQLAGYEFQPDQREDAERACEWIAATVEWWRSTHKGVKL